jgi:hypothetical protein
MLQSMTRRTFLVFSSVVATAVAVFAVCAPAALLAGKGVATSPALEVWVREVGAMIFAAAVVTFLARDAPDSLGLRALLVGNAVLHACLLPIEALAYAQGTIGKLSGVVPNTILHALLAVGFASYARRVHTVGR